MKLKCPLLEISAIFAHVIDGLTDLGENFVRLWYDSELAVGTTI